MKRLISIFLIFIIACASLCIGGCRLREADKVAYNVSKEADFFNVVRRITVINCRTDKVLYQLTGTFSINTNNNRELEVICELPDDVYTKHYIYLNDWTTYVVEDLSGANVSKYSYELNFLPEAIPGVKITGND
jgi:hypothetical protein